VRCEIIADVLQDRITRSEQLMKDSDRLRTQSSVLAVDGHELAQRVLDMKLPSSSRRRTPSAARRMTERRGIRRTARRMAAG
jgi:hypothetical protein